MGMLAMIIGLAGAFFGAIAGMIAAAAFSAMNSKSNSFKKMLFEPVWVHF